jgi:hypothetical protein
MSPEALCRTTGAYTIDRCITWDGVIRPFDPDGGDDWLRLGLAGGGFVGSDRLESYDADDLLFQAWYRLGLAGGGQIGDDVYTARECFEHAMKIGAPPQSSPESSPPSSPR